MAKDTSKIIDKFKDKNSLMEIASILSDEEKAKNLFCEFRWQDGVQCPFCGNDKFYITSENRPGYICAINGCNKKFTDRVTTIMDNSKIPYSTWLFYLYQASTLKKAVASRQFCKNLGISQKSAWSMMYKYRSLFENIGDDIEQNKLSGIIEVDECFLGSGTRWSRWGGITTKKSVIMGLMERNGRVIVEVIEDRKESTMMKIIDKYVEKGSTIYSDGHMSYRKLEKEYNHEWVSHSTHEYVRGDIHTNTIEGFWSLLKRSVRNGHHCVSSKHVQSYVNEFCFRHNNRSLSQIELFFAVLEMAAKPNTSRKFPKIYKEYEKEPIV